MQIWTAFGCRADAAQDDLENLLQHLGAETLNLDIGCKVGRPPGFVMQVWSLWLRGADQRDWSKWWHHQQKLNSSDESDQDKSLSSARRPAEQERRRREEKETPAEPEPDAEESHTQNPDHKQEGRGGTSALPDCQHVFQLVQSDGGKNNVWFNPDDVCKCIYSCLNLFFLKFHKSFYFENAHYAI